MITNYNTRKQISEIVFTNSDLGGRSAKEAVGCIMKGEQITNAESDPVTAVIVKYINDEEDETSMINSLNYAIRQIEIARDNIKSTI